MTDEYDKGTALYQTAMARLREAMVKRAKVAQAVMEGEREERAKTPPEESE